MEFRKMRRAKQSLSPQECREILQRGSSGVLAVLGDGGYPYAVPLSYVFDGEHIYFHCATSGHKLDAIRSNDKVSFCVIDQDQVIPKQFTTYFRSVIVFGTARILEDASEMRIPIEKLAEKYAWGHNPQQEIAKEISHMALIELTAVHISGKQAIELVRTSTAI